VTFARRPFLSRLERFESVDSTQRVVRAWLDDGVAEVAVAVADVQTSGRGRLGRTWVAPPGAALLVSCGFRPDELPLTRAWQLAATASLAMVDAAEEVAGLPDATLWLKWPNDIVSGEDVPRKVAGVLGETVADGDRVASAVVGIGINGDWAAPDFPAELSAAMTSLRELAHGRPTDREALLGAFLARLEPRYEALRAGRFDAAAWSTRQRQTGNDVEVALGDRLIEGRARGVDPASGALLLEEDGRTTSVDSGEVVRCRLMGRGP
jgi:BirA family transcriptional regulator, biotin operon repressor / biotin---[acetyl-CoA-carboxylase] ligase